MKKKEDLYITILRFGKTKLYGGFQKQSLVEYLNQSGFNDITLHSNFLTNYFHEIFFSKDVSSEYDPNTSAIFYLKPERYTQLLDYDNMLSARKEAAIAIWIAVASLIVTLVSVLWS